MTASGIQNGQVVIMKIRRFVRAVIRDSKFFASPFFILVPADSGAAGV